MSRLCLSALTVLVTGCVFGSASSTVGIGSTDGDGNADSSTTDPAGNAEATTNPMVDSDTTADAPVNDGTTAGDGSSTTSTPGTVGDTASSGGSSDSEAACDQLDDEPNDTMQMAQALAEHACHAKGPPVELMSTFADDRDADWYAGKFNWDCVPGEPTFEVSVDVAANVCVFADCENPGQFTTNCFEGQVVDTPPDGTQGCCGMSSVAMSINCSSGDESFFGVIAVQPAESDAVCVPYQLVYDSG